MLPIDDRLFERVNPVLAGRPDLMLGRKSLMVYEGMFAIPENAFINVKNTSFSITADALVGDQPATGVLIAQGGRFGGWSLYVKDGRPTYHHNFLGKKRFTIAAAKPLAPGKAAILFDFAYDGGGAEKGGLGALFVKGEKVGEGRIDVTQCCGFSATEGADVGLNTGTPVSTDYENPFRFSGKIGKVTIDLKDDASKDADKADIEQQRGDAKLKKAVSD